MTLTMTSFRYSSQHELAAMLRIAHNYTLCLFECLTTPGINRSAKETEPFDDHLDFNAPLWDLGYLSWFAERLILRDAPNQRGSRIDEMKPSMLSQADDWFDPEISCLDTRSSLGLPKAAKLITYKKKYSTGYSINSIEAATAIWNCNLTG